jgi:hypothetical protein
MGLPKCRKTYGNGELIVAAALGHTVRVTPKESEVTQHIQLKQYTPCIQGRYDVSYVNRKERNGI